MTLKNSLLHKSDYTFCIYAECSSLSLGGLCHHGIYKQGTLKEAPVGSPREAFYTE